jgi:hypothetical protein
MALDPGFPHTSPISKHDYARNITRASVGFAPALQSGPSSVPSKSVAYITGEPSRDDIFRDAVARLAAAFTKKDGVILAQSNQWKDVAKVQSITFMQNNHGFELGFATDEDKVIISLESYGLDFIEGSEMRFTEHPRINQEFERQQYSLEFLTSTKF